ncbi:hypothetical protein P6B95_01295 [Streptomyces atratus]|uniref:hypothetical protein n=1 Tax=Streptomyces atratus TaxID=1893 RepID=UPI001670E797|nr:hypothetical protein [Streptomyces atratus]WPW33765.1 hypothetical protein P6B95_01295 [Streptomyces atratus]
MATDAGFSGAFLSAIPDGAGFAQDLDRNARGFAELTRRAKESDRLRADFAPGDLRRSLMANAGIVANSPSRRRPRPAGSWPCCSSASAPTRPPHPSPCRRSFPGCPSHRRKTGTGGAPRRPQPLAHSNAGRRPADPITAGQVVAAR